MVLTSKYINKTPLKIPATVFKWHVKYLSRWWIVAYWDSDPQKPKPVQGAAT